MPLTLADIERWDAHDIDDVARALNKRAASMDEINTALQRLPTNDTWSGQAAQAARQRLDKLSAYLAAHAETHQQAATIMAAAVGEIQGVQKQLRDIQAFAEGRFAIDLITAAVIPLQEDSSAADEAEIVAAVASILSAGTAIDAELAQAVGLLTGADRFGSDGGAGAFTTHPTPVGDAPRSPTTGNAAAEPAAGSQGSAGDGTSGFTPTGGDVAIGSAGAVAGGTADGVGKATLKVIGESPTTGPGAPSPGLAKWFEDPKIGGVELKGFSRVGRVVGVAGAIPAVFSDIHDGNSVAEAVTREGVGLGAGLWAGAATGGLIGSAFPGVGTAVGVVVGAGAGALAATGASKLVGMAWNPVAEAVGGVGRGVKSLFGFG